MFLARLTRFLVQRFTAAEIRRLIVFSGSTSSSALPTGGPSLDDLALAAADALDRRGEINQALFDELRRARPALAQEIDQLAAVFRWMRGYPPVRVLSPPPSTDGFDEHVRLISRLLRADGLADDEALELAEALLGRFPEPLVGEQWCAVGARARPVADNLPVAMCEPGQVRLRWPPLVVSAYLNRSDGPAAALAGRELITAYSGQTIDIEVRARIEVDVSAVSISHRLSGSPQRAVLAQERTLSAAGVWVARVELDEDWGVEQFLFHVRPRPDERGARIVTRGAAPRDPSGLPFAAERARLLADHGPGWLIECLVDHPPGEIFA